MERASRLPSLQAAGFTAYVDAFAAEPAPDPETQLTRLHVLSLLGSKQAVQAIWARLIKGEPVTLSRGMFGATLLCTLNLASPRGWKLFTASLPAVAGYHALLVPDLALISTNRAEFLILPRQPGDAATLHFRFLDRRVDLPFHPSWADWLWERARRTSEATTLESFGLQAFHCAPDPLALAADLGAAMRSGALTVTANDEMQEPEPRKTSPCTARVSPT